MSLTWYYGDRLLSQTEAGIMRGLVIYVQKGNASGDHV